MRRSMLFLPGNNPNMLINGDILGADAIILDLEDAVAPDEKDAARILVRNALRALRYEGVEVIIRINAVDDDGFWMEDLRELVPLRPTSFMPTKVRDADYIRTVCALLDRLEAECGVPVGSTRLLPLIETARGLENAFAIAEASPRVEAIFLGAEDLTADLQCARTKEGEEILWARCRMVSAARAAGIEVFDTPFTDIEDDEGLVADIRKAKSLGFSGKASISPRHVKEINRIFSPTPGEVEYAGEVLEAIEQAKRLGKGAVSLRGKMIDAPIVSRAKRVLEMDSAIKKGGNGVG